MARKPRKDAESASLAEPTGDNPTEEVTSDIEDAVIVEPKALPNSETDVQIADEKTLVSEPTIEHEKSQDDPVSPEPARPQVADPARSTVEPSGPARSVVPLVIGGILAGGIGFGLATVFDFTRIDDLRTTIAAQATQIDVLGNKVAELPVTDLGPLQSKIDSVQADLTAKIDVSMSQTAAALADLQTRLSAAEKAPSGDGTLSAPAIAAYQRELQDLRDEIASQQDRMNQMVTDTSAQLEQTRTEAAAIEENAAAAARLATAQSALAQVLAALDTGEGFSGPLADFQASTDTAVPAALSSVASDGVPTLASLQDGFPEAARAALAAARREGQSGEDGSGLTAFLRTQLNIRSVEPRDGTDADAILSRAQAALADGRLTDALAEVAALPEVARAELTDWLALAQKRADAVAAADGLSATLTSN